MRTVFITQAVKPSRETAGLIYGSWSREEAISSIRRSPYQVAKDQTICCTSYRVQELDGNANVSCAQHILSSNQSCLGHDRVFLETDSEVGGKSYNVSGLG